MPLDQDTRDAIIVGVKAAMHPPRPRVPHFEPVTDSYKNARNWDDWIYHLEQEFGFMNITTPEEKKSNFLIAVGPKIAKLNDIYADDDA